MKGYEPGRSFDEDAAAVYDDEPRGDEEAAVAFLERLAGDGRALELAIGTGRIALPLAARGVPVEGIDISGPMVARLRAKPGGDRIPVTMGDFADVPVSGTYRIVYIVFNTLFNLLSQEEQVRCFENVAGHLDGGRRVRRRGVRARPTCTGFAMTSMWTPRRSRSRRCGLTSAATIRSARCSRRATSG